MGITLTCVGDDRAYSYVASRDGNTIADYFLNKNLKKVKNFKKYHYTERGLMKDNIVHQELIFQFVPFQDPKVIRNTTLIKMILK